MVHSSGRAGNSRDVEAPAEAMISGDSLLRGVVEGLDRTRRKSVTYQQANISSFDSQTEFKSTRH